MVYAAIENIENGLCAHGSGCPTPVGANSMVGISYHFQRGLLAMAGLLGACTGSAEELISELKRRAVQEGLAIADLEVQGPPPRLTIVRFGEYYPLYSRFSKTFMLARFSPSGLEVAGETFERELIICKLDGTELRRLSGQILNIHALSLSKNSEVIAFSGSYSTTPPGSRPRDRFMGITVVDIERNRFVQVRQFSDESERFNGYDLSLSPSAKHLVYDWNGKIFVHDLRTGAARLLTDGEMPAWSPDGQWIAFRDPSGILCVVPPDNPTRARRFPGHKPLGGFRWSPDSRYLAFGEKKSGSPIPVIAPFIASHLVVLRLEDAASVGVRDTGDPEIGRDQGWVYFDFNKLIPVR